MSTMVRAQTAPCGLERPVMKPLDEAVWQAWVAKGRAREQYRSAARVRAAKWVSIAGILVVAALWSYLPPFEVAARAVIAAGALVVMFAALNAKQYAVAAVSLALVVLYNPLAHAFTFSGNWHRLFVVASTVPFIASLVWSASRSQHNDVV